MCKATDFIYLQIYRGALQGGGASERAAKDNAVLGLEDFRRGRFRTPAALIVDRISKAKADSRQAPAKATTKRQA